MTTVSATARGADADEVSVGGGAETGAGAVAGGAASRTPDRSRAAAFAASSFCGGTMGAAAVSCARAGADSTSWLRGLSVAFRRSRGSGSEGFEAATSPVRVSAIGADTKPAAGVGLAWRPTGDFTHTTTATAAVVAIGTSQRTVDVCHHLRVASVDDVRAIAASIA